MRTRMIGLFCLIVITLAGAVAVQAGPPPGGVANFTIVGPLAVITGQAFPIDVMENDSNWRPIAPGDTGTVHLSAWINNGTPVTISPSIFVASGSGDDIINVTVNAPIGAWVGIRAQGYGIGPVGPNAQPIFIAGGSSSEAQYFGLSAPSSANPNQPFPLYITPLAGGDSTHVGNPAPFSGTVNLWANVGATSPTSVNINVPAGESARVLVSLDTASLNNKIHASAQGGGGGGGPTPMYTVDFSNHDATQLGRNDHKIRPDLSPTDSSLSAIGVQPNSVWQSMIWPIKADHPEEGWNILSFIPGAGPGGLGVQLHLSLAPSFAPLDSLPGSPFDWSPNFVVNTDQAHWELISGAFPPAGLDGTYWVKQEVISMGDAHPRLNTSFINNSSQLDRALITIEREGRANTQPDTLSKFGVKGALWSNMIWNGGLAGAGPDSVYHLLSNFMVPDSAHGQPGMAPVWIHSILYPSSQPRPSYPDTAGWNPNYLVNPATDFLQATGDPLPPGFNGSYWARLEAIANPEGGDHRDLFGWSNEINTTGQPIAGTTLRVDEVFAAPGGEALLNVILHNDQPVAGLQFRINPQHQDGSHAWEATFRGVINDLENQGFSFTSNTDQDGVTTLLLFNLSNGNPLPPGDHILGELVYHIDQNAPYGDWIMMNVTNSILSDPNSHPISHNTVNGSIHVGRRGDLNATGDINILDVIQEIKYVLGRLPLPTDPFVFFLADVNGDGNINVLDVVRMINIVLGRATAKPIAGPSGPVRLELGELQTLDQGRTVIPLRAQFDGAVAGLQLTLTYDPAVLTLGEVQPTAHLAGLTVESFTTPGTLHLLIYSVDGHVFRAGTLSTLLTVPVTVQGSATGTLTLSQVVVASAQAQRVPTSLTTSTVKVSALPSAFALKPNRPNPFNPTTAIAYEVPQAAHITLAIYNILGQEVVRLVDAQQAPGRYVVRWEGRNAQGLSVASGVYLYRLTTSTGFTQTRRMTLLK